MDTQTPFSGPSDEWVEGKLRRDLEDSRKRIAELEQENERLKLERDPGADYWLERAAEIVADTRRTMHNDYSRALEATEQAIRAELEPATTPDPLSQDQGDAKADED